MPQTCCVCRRYFPRRCGRTRCARGECSIRDARRLWVLDTSRGRGHTSGWCSHLGGIVGECMTTWCCELVFRETFLMIRDANSPRSGQPRLTSCSLAYMYISASTRHRESLSIDFIHGNTWFSRNHNLFSCLRRPAPYRIAITFVVSLSVQQLHHPARNRADLSNLLSSFLGLCSRMNECCNPSRR